VPDSCGPELGSMEFEDLPLSFGPFNHSETAKIAHFVASNLGHAAIDVKLCARDIAGFVRRKE